MSCWRKPERRPAIVVIAVLLIGVITARSGWAQAAPPPETTAQLAARMSQQSFALLGSLNSQSGGGATNPLLGPVATFASDTDALKQALATADPTAQARAINTLAGDCAVIDQGVKANPKALPGDDWRTIRRELDQVAHAVVASTADKLGAAPPAGAAVPVAKAAASLPAAATVPPVSAPPMPSAATAPAAPSAPPILVSAPVVRIESRTMNGDSVRIKGYLEGENLQSAGIYENGRALRTFEISKTPGRQRIDLDIGVASPPPDAMLRVTDAQGHFAEAPVLEATAALPPSSSEAALPDEPSGAGSSNEGGVEVDRNRPAGPSSEGDDAGSVADIPSHGVPHDVPAPAPRSPSHRHTLGGRLANVQVDVMGVTQTATSPPSYEVVGIINGQGVTRAGIYVDGRLVKTMPVEDGSDFTNFDQRFTMSSGTATVRAYGAGGQFVESPIDLNDGLASVQPLPPGSSVYATRPSAPGVGVLITSVRPLAGNLYQVTGTVSGNIASAGLYQNGVLAQPISPSGLSGMISGAGGLGSMLGGLLPGSSQSTNFNLRFNPSLGAASIRAYDRTGNFTEQPVMAGNTVNPYGAVPYGTAPYPYGVNPYGANPYGTNPYGYPNRTNPYPPGVNPGPINPYVINGPSSGSTRPLW